MFNYDSRYSNSWALCVGINSYKNVSPLEYAVNDAEEVAKILIEEFAFPKDNVTILINEDASKTQILKSYLDLSGKTELNDRVIFYFAGHGHTVNGNRGEVGYLIPYDAFQNDLSTLIRWDELTKNSELISAKHLLFFLDACFSGLAITRSLSSGTMRFVKDMLQRYSRQALAAGKANQPVSDGNGPLPMHSVFTGHLINGLRGDAVTTKGILTANGLMHYVYQKVANDSKSFQTPHYGYIDGDGDFILKYPIETNSDTTKQEDILFEVSTNIDSLINNEETFLQRIKTFISEDKYRIKLDDLIRNEITKAISELNETNFPSYNGKVSEDYLRETLQKFQSVLSNLQIILITVSYWGNEFQKEQLLKIFLKLCSHISYEQSSFTWQSLRWYSIIWLHYSVGISLLIKEDYKTLYKVLSLETKPYNPNQKDNSLIFSYASAFSEITSQELFKNIKEHERHFAPISEYIFKKLQPIIEDILFIGDGYEIIYDKYEVLIGLESSMRHIKFYDSCWAPSGRYGWKYRNRTGNQNPVTKLIEQGKTHTVEWAPLKSGFFDSNYDVFSTTADKFVEHVKKLNWY